MSRSLVTMPGHLGVGRVGHQQVHAVRAEPREPAEVGEPAVQRQLVHLEVAGVQDHAGRRADGDRERVRDGVVHREKFKPEGTERLAGAGRRFHGGGREPVLGELASDQAEGQLRADQREVGALAEQVRDGADVVLVGVGEHHRLDLAEAAVQVGEVGQDQVHPRLVGLGEQHPAVHDEQPPGVLEHGHVPADLAEAAEPDDAQSALGQGRGGGEARMRVAHQATPLVLPTSRALRLVAPEARQLAGREAGPRRRDTAGAGSCGPGSLRRPAAWGRHAAPPGSFTPPATRSVRSRSTCCGVASISGPRTVPPGSPSRLSAALVAIAPWVRVMMPM